MMANNHQDVVGVIKVKLVTPVIRALFGCYNLDEKYPGNGHVYIASSDSNYTGAYWETMMPDLGKLCDYLKVKLPEVVRYRIDDNYGCEENEVEFGSDLVCVFENLFSHFSTITYPAAQKYLQNFRAVDGYDTPELKWLFEMAQLMDDGHGLEYYQVDAAYYCDKPRLGEFGGWGEYRSNTYSTYISSHWANVRGQEVDRMLASQDYAGVGNYVGVQFTSVLHGIVDPHARQQVANASIRQLNEIYNPIPQGVPASNEAVANPYEKISVLMTADEQRDEIAHSMYSIARKWGDAPATLDPYDRVCGAMSDFVELLQEGNGATIPPMQLYPINPNNHPYDPHVYRAGTQLKDMELARWNFGQPMPLVDENGSLQSSFEIIAEAMEQRRIDAAKKMFGT
jgi:hypothetical protein